MLKTACGVVVAAAGIASGDLLIDDFMTGFSAGGGELGTDTGVFTSFEASPANAIGDRTTDVTIDGDPAAGARFSINPSVLGGLQITDIGPGIPDALFTLTYSNFGTQDLTAAGDRFEFTIFSSDLDLGVPGDVLEVFFTIGGETVSLNVIGPGVYEVAFTDFTTADLTSVTELTWGFDTAGLDALDLTIADIRVTPTPGAAAVLGLGGLVVLRRRR